MIKIIKDQMEKNWIVKEVVQSLLTSFWFMFLTFPVMVMKVVKEDGVSSTIYRWKNLIAIGIASFFLSALWRYLIKERENWGNRDRKFSIQEALTSNPKRKKISMYSAASLLLLMPLLFKILGNPMYYNNIMISVFIYIILGLGLNIVIGYGGLLHLGYASFYAVGAYTYGLFFHYIGPKFMALGANPAVMFWIAIPAGILLSLLYGALVCLPVIRLRGDYLAIVTLAFGEITRMVLENWGKVTQGPSGISQIPRAWVPGFLVGGKSTNNPIVASYTLYFIALMFVVITIIVVKNMENSRLGRAWEAMREDEIAAQSMGIDLTMAKFKSFALGALWAGIAGVLLATKTTFVNPASFTLWESVLILCVVVLGGMGSIPGVVFGSFIMIMLPELFRGFSGYRMLVFGAVLVLMMIFKPDGVLPRIRKKYTFEETEKEGN